MYIDKKVDHVRIKDFVQNNATSLGQSIF